MAMSKQILIRESLIHRLLANDQLKMIPSKMFPDMIETRTSDGEWLVVTPKHWTPVDIQMLARFWKSTHERSSKGAVSNFKADFAELMNLRMED